MTENTNMTKERKGRKLAVQFDETKITQKKKNLNAKKKRVCSSSQCRKKTSVRQKAKENNVEMLRKVPKKIAVSSILVKHNKEIFDHQIKQLNLVLKRSLKCPTLTQEELQMLFLKYKLDGHYRPNKNLTPFTSLTDGTSGTTNAGQFYDAMQSMSIPDVQVTNYENSNEAAGNLYPDIDGANQFNKENLNVYRNMQINLKHDAWKPKAVLKESNVVNKINNNYLPIEQCPVINSNYNHILTSYDAQTCSNATMFNDTQNIDQSESNLDVNRISNIAAEDFSYSSMNPQSSLPEDQSYGYANEGLLCTLPNTSLEYENVNSSSDTSQQNDVQYQMQCNDLWNQNLCNDFYLKNWNNNVFSMNDNNVQAWKSEAMCAYTGNLEPYYHKNLSEGQSNFDSNVNMFHSMASDIMPYVADSRVNSQQDFNSYYGSTSTVASSNFLADTNGFIPSYVNMSNQCMQ